MDEATMEPPNGDDDMEIDDNPNNENSKEGLDLEANLEPYEGMEFESEEAARSFYAAYARHVGFRSRISRYTRSRRDNTIISRLIVCSKEGFRESRGNNDGVYNGERKRQRAVTRVGCKAMLMVKKLAEGKWVVSKFVKEHNHGPVPPRKVEVRVRVSQREEEESAEKLNLSFDGGEIHEPIEGMEFDSEEDARSFYINYARRMGFRARISKYCRSRRDNSIISRQIVCSKEGFREVRIKEEMEDGRVKRPRVVTRVGCKAMVIVKKMSSGKWVVSRFDKEHNHPLLAPQILQSSNDSTQKSSFDCVGEANVLSNGSPVTSRESLTVLYKRLCYEAIKFAQEGAVSQEIYGVAMSALKEAVEKVAVAKRSSGIQCSNEGNIIGQEREVEFMEQPFKFVLIPSTSFVNDAKLANNSLESPVILNVLNGQGTNKLHPISVLKQSSASTESVGALVGTGSGSTLQASAVQNSEGVVQVKANIRSCNLIVKGVSEAQMVALPAHPVTVYMGGLSESSSVTASDTSGNDLMKLQSPRSYAGPNPQVHATAIAAGARIVPPHEAASLIKAIKARVRSVKSVGPKQQLSSNELPPNPRPRIDITDNDRMRADEAREAFKDELDSNTGNDRMRAHDTREASKELDPDVMEDNNSSLYDIACEDHHLFSDGGS